MDDILGNFLAQNADLLKNAPLDFFENYHNKATGKLNGIHIVWLMAWGAEGKKLVPEIQSNFPLNSLQHDAADVAIKYCLAATGGALKANCFESGVIDFVQRYYQPGWNHNYLTDIEALIPELSDFGDLVHSQSMYKNVVLLISQRYRKWQIEG